MKNVLEMKKEFQAGIDMMWQAHPDIGHKWKLPSPLACIMYAATECTEILNSLADVIDGQEHYRNNPKDRNTKEEIADTIMMLGRYCMSCKGDANFLFCELRQKDADHFFERIKEYNFTETENIINLAFIICGELINTAGAEYLYKRQTEANLFIERACYLLFSLLDEGEYVELLDAKLQKYRKKIIGANE